MVTEFPAKDGSGLNIEKNASLTARVHSNANQVLKFLRELDENPGYEYHNLSASENQLLKSYLEIMPPAYLDTMRQHLTGIYFVKDFVSSAYTEWFIKPDGKIYLIMVFNPELLKESLSEGLQRRAETVFKKGRIDFSIRFSKKGDTSRSLLFYLAHELTHAYDYIKGVSPYLDTEHQAFFKKPLESCPFAASAWKDIRKPLHPFENSDKISFYGFRKGPHLEASDAVPLFEALVVSDFVSLYASQSWGEDIAETFSYAYLSKRMGFEYSIKLHGRGVVHPLENKKVIQRLKFLDNL